MNIQFKEQIQLIIDEELKAAQSKIWSRIEPLLDAQTVADILAENEPDETGELLPPLPDNPNYKTTLDLYNQGENFSSISRILGVSLPTVRRYYTWLAINGYAPVFNENLTDSEKFATNLIYDKGYSLTEVAEELNCSTSNVTHLRNSALSKGFIPEYFIKILFPAFYQYTNNPKIGFPQNRSSLASKIQVGQKCFIYLTSPEKRIIALVEITSPMITTSGRWPFQFDIKFIIPPKEGISLKEANVDFRPRPGDTYIPIDSQIAKDITNKLNSQTDLTLNQLKELADKYQE